MKKINYRIWSQLSDKQKEKIFSRSEININEIREDVEKIIERVRRYKDKALIDYAKKFDGADISAIPLRVQEKEFDAAERTLSTEVKSALEFAIENVRRFHLANKPQEHGPVNVRAGIMAREKMTPVESVALYVPRGRGSFPSMLYMLGVPAVEAGVKRVCVVTPPNPDGTVDAACLYAARLCGINEVYRTGGAQAIAALAYGTESIKPVVKVVGPGSKYVSAAKRILYGKIDVGLPAGPSESILLADKTSDPYLAALDLMVEAEHGSDSSALLITSSKDLADKSLAYIKQLVKNIPEPRKTFLTDVMAGYGGIILTDDMDTACDIVNEFAPEHLEIMTENPEATASKIRNAGEILLGTHTPFSAANYTTGPNAVLPTGGTAKTFSAVSIRDFVKYSSVIEVTESGYEELKPHAVALADYEGFITHGNAFKLRK
ncbi:MAG: histidinol dehydrogenase [Spirochaetia bacterium]|nr:histidinol dehydrogenase [Spirochaetia bacterium]